MQAHPLNVIEILEFAAKFYGSQEIVSVSSNAELHRYNYSQALDRTKQCALALQDLNLQAGDRIGTLAWNDHRHFESWYAISGQGGITHTINPRLYPDQIEYIINHAQDKIILADPKFADLLDQLRPRLRHVEQIVFLCSEQDKPDTSMSDALCYESLLQNHAPDFCWPQLEETHPAGMCYTSGTTGEPKGVSYTHRSNILMAYATVSPNAFSISARSCILMVVPMFHANAWSLVHSAPMAGAKLVLPGPFLDGASLHRLILSEAVTFSAGVPTVWSELLNFLQKTKSKLDGLQEIVIGGSAVPRSMIEAFERDYEVSVIHAWGMTEISPLGTVNRPVPQTNVVNEEQQLDRAQKQGIPLFGLQMGIKNGKGELLPHDDNCQGNLVVKGPWVIDSYYKSDITAVDPDGWFDTGDIATIDKHGYMHIKDRAKDIIKSGGEWISSVELENEAMGHSEVERAAVIGVPDQQWSERPVLIAKRKDKGTLTESQLIDFLKKRVAKWWLPDKILFVADIPLTATGKLDKKQIRERYENNLLETNV